MDYTTYCLSGSTSEICGELAYICSITRAESISTLLRDITFETEMSGFLEKSLETVWQMNGPGSSVGIATD